MKRLIEYWLKFKKWKPKIIQIGLTFVFLAVLAGVAEQKEWFFPLLWLEGIEVNYIDIVSILFPQLMMFKRVIHPNYDPS